MPETDTTVGAADKDIKPVPTTPGFTHEQSLADGLFEVRIQPHSTPVLVGSDGVHDFDLKDRVKGPRKLTKLSHRVSKSVSLSTTSGSGMDAPRHGSDASDPVSIRRRLSSFMTGPINPGRRLVPMRSSSTTAVTNTATREEDPVPDDKKELESRLNYHLAELDELKRVIRLHNEIIRTADSRMKMIQSRNLVNQSCSIKKLVEAVDTAIHNRDTYATYVEYHRDQLERIKQKRLVLDREAGVESPTIPEVFHRIWQFDDWAALFSLGR